MMKWFGEKLLKFKLKRVYVQLLTAIITSVFLTAIIVGFISYYTSATTVMDNITREKNSTLSQTKNSIDTSLKEIEKLFVSKTMDPIFLRFVSDPFGRDYQYFNSAMQSLIGLKNDSRFIYSIYLYLPSQKVIITTEDGRWKSEEFYDLKWLESIKAINNHNWLPSRRITSFSKEQSDVVTFLIPIPYSREIKPDDCLFVVNINEKELYRQIQPPNPRASQLTYIVDSEGRIITHKDKTLLGKEAGDRDLLDRIGQSKAGSFTAYIDNSKHLVSYVISDYNRWKYIGIVQESQITGSILYITVVNIIVASLCIIFGIIAAVLISSRIYKPISDVILSVASYSREMGDSHEGKGSSNELDFLNKAISSIVEKSKNLNTTLRKNAGILKEMFIQELLVSSFTDETELENKLKELDISFSNRYYYIFVIGIDKYAQFSRKYQEKDRDLFCFGIKNITEEIVNSGNYGLTFQVEKDMFVSIVNSNDGQEQIRDMADGIRKNINEIFKFTVTIGVSGQFERIGEASFAYHEALEALKQRVVFGGDRVILNTNPGQKNKLGLLISTSREEQIFNAISQGNMDEVERLLDKIVNSLKDSPVFPPEEIYQLFYSVLGCAIKTVMEKGWSASDIFGDKTDLYKELFEHENILDMKRWIVDILKRMSHFISEKKESKNAELIENILKYMHTNYNKDINLNMVSEFVYLSPSYLSKLFKDETGKNYIEYLTEIRIQKSKEMLRNPEYKIAEIAEKVKLGSVQNFIRMFKRYCGVTPGQYRDMHAKDKLSSK